MLVSYCRYCTEILALLPFTSPDEPLYLIYAINRIIQVRAGVLEAKLKALSVHLSQRVASRENGIFKEDPSSCSFPYEMASMDLSRAIHQEPASEAVSNHMSSVDLNGKAQEDLDEQSVLNQNCIDGMGSGDSRGISKDDELIIQVGFELIICVLFYTPQMSIAFLESILNVCLGSFYNLPMRKKKENLLKLLVCIAAQDFKLV